jgi:hypothetical protein
MDVKLRTLPAARTVEGFKGGASTLDSQTANFSVVRMAGAVTADGTSGDSTNGSRLAAPGSSWVFC